jgi:hypothetical protein
MTAEPSPAPIGDMCPLCASRVASDLRRCPSCGYHLAGIGGRPGPFAQPVLWLTAIGFLAVYLGTLAIVALTH